MWFKGENKEKAGISEVWRDIDKEQIGKVFYSKSIRKPFKGF